MQLETEAISQALTALLCDCRQVPAIFSAPNSLTGDPTSLSSYILHPCHLVLATQVPNDACSNVGGWISKYLIHF